MAHGDSRTAERPDARIDFRIDGRRADQLRPLSFELDVQRHAAGSAIAALGETRVLCAVTAAERVPPFLRGGGSGWITAEYNMLPAATNTRSDRQRVLAAGRTHEIQRLIGRSLRAAADLEAFGERAFTIDCDVLQADGGTRTAAINGAWVALQRALAKLGRAGVYERAPQLSPLAAVSIGLLDGQALVDLCYEEDAAADVDLNLVATGGGAFVEIQGTAERKPFTSAQLEQMLNAGRSALEQIFTLQQEAISA